MGSSVIAHHGSRVETASDRMTLSEIPAHYQGVAQFSQPSIAATQTHGLKAPTTTPGMPDSPTRQR